MPIALFLAQAAPPAAQAPQQGVVSYGPEFFAAQQPGNALDMINRVPGFTFDRGDSVRGFEGAAGNVLVDGQRPSSKSDTLDEILRRIPAARVARIEVIRGGAPGVDMQGKTVLANVVRKSGGGLKAMAEAKNFFVQDGRNSGGLRLEASGGDGERAWEVGLRGQRAVDDGAGDGPGLRIFGSGAPSQPYYINGEADGQQYTATGAYEAGALGGRLRLNGRLYSDKYKAEETDQLFAPAPGIESQLDTELVKESEIGLRFTRALDATTSLEAIGLRQTHDADIDVSFADAGGRSAFSRSSDRTETIGRLVLKRQWSAALSLEAGGETAVNKQGSRTRFAVDGRDVPLPAAAVEVEEKRSEVFLKSSWRPAARWTLDAALRYETSTISSEGDVVLKKSLRYVKPRLTVAWSPTPGAQLRLRGEREVGQLNFNDYVATANLTTTGSVFAGNPDLNPERAWVVEAALEQQFWGSGSLALTARRYELSDVIDRAPVFAADGRVFDAPANIGSGRKDELLLELTLPTDRLALPNGQLKGNVTRRWTEVSDPTTHSRRGISGAHPVAWNLSVSQDVPRWRLTWGADVSGGYRERYYRFNQIEDLKISTLVRPYVEVRPRPDLNLRAEIFNATQRGVRDFNTVYPGPRSAGGRPDVQARNQTYSAYGVLVRLRKTFGG
jgi:outer membrane receptor protein involved in Fe transport